jgi:hypothetical protein
VTLVLTPNLTPNLTPSLTPSLTPVIHAPMATACLLGPSSSPPGPHTPVC